MTQIAAHATNSDRHGLENPTPPHSFKAPLPGAIDAWNLLPAILSALIGWRCFGIWGAVGLLLFTGLIIAAVSARRPAWQEMRSASDVPTELTVMMVVGLLGAVVVTLGMIVHQLDSQVLWGLNPSSYILLCITPLLVICNGGAFGLVLGSSFLLGVVVLFCFANAFGVQGPAPMFSDIILRPESPFLLSLWESSKEAYQVQGYGRLVDLQARLIPTAAATVAAMAGLWMLFRCSRNTGASGRGDVAKFLVLGIGALMIPMAAAAAMAVVEHNRPTTEQIVSEVRIQWGRDLVAACQDLRLREDASIREGKTTEEVILRTRQADRAIVSSGC